MKSSKGLILLIIILASQSAWGQSSRRFTPEKKRQPAKVQNVFFEDVEVETEYVEEVAEPETSYTPRHIPSEVMHMEATHSPEEVTEVERSTQRLTISETNDAAAMGLQEALTPDEYRPNDIGYTHGLSIEYENIDVHLFGMSGAFRLTYVSDLITEYRQKTGVTIQGIELLDEDKVMALDVYQLKFEYEKHPTRSGLNFFFGSGVEFITDSPSFSGGAAFLSGRERQNTWHQIHESQIYKYESENKSRYSINTQAGVGIEKQLFSSAAKVTAKAGYLLKSSESQQAKDESKGFALLKFSLNDFIRSPNYYHMKSDRFAFFFGGNGEFGKGQEANAFVGFDKNINGFLGQYELSFKATFPLVLNEFDYGDFTEVKVFDEKKEAEGGILDYEPVYTLSLTAMW